MKTFLKILLTILFIPVFLVFLVLLSFKFQLLNSNFWTTTFEKNNVYQNLENIIPKVMDSQAKTDGGELDIDTKVLTSILNKENLKIFFEKNIKFTLDYLNGAGSEWVIFIPREVLPKNLLPNFLMESDEIPAKTLLSFFSRGRGDPFEIPYQVPLTGRSVLLLLSVWIIILISLSLLLHRLRILNVSLFASGFTALLLSGAVILFSKVIEVEWFKEGEPSQLILGTIGPPIARGVVEVWLIIGATAIISSFVLGYLQKNRKLK